MPRERIGERIKRRLARISMSQAELARLARVSQPSVNAWVAGRTDPDRENIPLIAKALKTTVYWLEFGEGSNGGNTTDKSGLPLRQVPLISWVQAGQFVELFDPFEPGDADEWIPVPARNETLIALQIEGNSMDREFPEKTVIVVDYRDKSLIEGDFYVFRCEDESTLKRWREQPSRLEPYSTDPRHETIFPTSTIEVVGRVIASVKRY